MPTASSVLWLITGLGISLQCGTVFSVEHICDPGPPEQYEKTPPPEANDTGKEEITEPFTQELYYPMGIRFSRIMNTKRAFAHPLHLFYVQKYDTPCRGIPNMTTILQTMQYELCSETDFLGKTFRDKWDMLLHKELPKDAYGYSFYSAPTASFDQKDVSSFEAISDQWYKEGTQQNKFIYGRCYKDKLDEFRKLNNFVQMMAADSGVFRCWTITCPFNSTGQPGKTILYTQFYERINPVQSVFLDDQFCKWKETEKDAQRCDGGTCDSTEPTFPPDPDDTDSDSTVLAPGVIFVTLFPRLFL